MKSKLYKHLANTIQARLNCINSDNDTWEIKHSERLKDIQDNLLPSGSGFDNGTTIDLDMSSGEKLVFSTAFHHMNDGGMYDGWTEHSVIVTASLLSDFNIRVTGKNRNDIKEYISEQFGYILGQEYIQTIEGLEEVKAVEA